MSKNTNAAPVRDWLLKKYQKALRTIWEQTAELQDIRMRNSGLLSQLSAREARHRAELDAQDKQFRETAKLMTDGITVVLHDQGMEVPLDVLFKASSPNGLEVGVQLPPYGVVRSEPGDTINEPIGMMDAVNEALGASAFRAYQCGAGDLPSAPFLNREVATRYTKDELEQTYLGSCIGSRAESAGLIDGHSQGYPLGPISAAFND